MNTIFALALLLAAGLPAHAQNATEHAIEQFYRGRQITMLIATSPGGGYDTYGRLLGRHLGRHIPGTPAVIAANMAGAGSNVATAHIFTAAPKDGTFIGAIFAGAIVEPLLGDKSRFRHDPSRLQFVGSANTEVFVCAVRADQPIRTLADMQRGEVVVGSSADGGPTSDFPTMLAAVLGAKLRIVRGYPGTREISLAIEKGEVAGACGLSWATLSVQYPRIIEGNPFRIILQEDMKGHPVLNAAGIAVSGAFATAGADAQALELFYAQNQFGRPYVMAPEVPPERLAAIRRGFMAAMADPELLAEAKRLNIDIIPRSGEDVQAIVTRLYATPQPVLDRVRKALGRER